ncbi:lysozyme inhibitor LprI family protein [Stakelama pacifica]|uniref:Uncharacterized protein YecT (DUF1311 family) n=1 Tax=Stakelama pacifica TaxID=517720 RepID=A0A4R6FUC2_9SPHN|nr:lysozyme inhibitor LprI family protein [Stakelama pacifica]TDN85469.1 uncharacterized protein YecT (DUF1311 family) [Stakelama pacifica]GGO92560.1 hypothetical protein GCM10011329_09920 [Stakelama pacifica]
MIAALALLALLPMQAGGKTDPCEGSTTIAVNQCLANQVDAAQAELDRYLAAARERVAQGAGDPPAATEKELLTGFDAAQKAWEKYRDAQCDNIYRYWQSGTIRGAMALGCKLELTRERAHFIWESFLTYMDSTPPVLPEPGVGSDD